MTELNLNELEAGTRVHHRGSIWSRSNGEGGGWGTVILRVPQHDGSSEYLIQPDTPLVKDGSNKPRWWASYHIDEAHPGTPHDRAPGDRVRIYYLVQPPREATVIERQRKGWLKCAEVNPDGIEGTIEYEAELRKTDLLERPVSDAEAKAIANNNGPRFDCINQFALTGEITKALLDKDLRHGGAWERDLDPARFWEYIDNHEVRGPVKRWEFV